MIDSEIIRSRFRAMLLPNGPLEKLADRFRWLEGPVCFGERRYSRLFLYASQGLYAIWTNRRGAQRP